MTYQDTCRTIDKEFAVLSAAARDRLKSLIEQNRRSAYDDGVRDGVLDANSGKFRGSQIAQDALKEV